MTNGNPEFAATACAALTPRRWAVVRALLDTITIAADPITATALAEGCPPRLEYTNCTGRHTHRRGTHSIDCFGEVDRTIRDHTAVAIQPEIALLRDLGWIEAAPPRAGRTQRYLYSGPPGPVGDLMHPVFRWQPPRRPPRCPEDDDTYLTFYPDPARERPTSEQRSTYQR